MKKGLGRLSYDDAVRHHTEGRTRRELAALAGVNEDTVSRWRRRNGLARKYEPFDIGDVDRRTYQREYARQRRRWA